MVEISVRGATKGMRYDLSVMEMLNLLGVRAAPAAKAKLADFEEMNAQKMPVVLSAFLQAVADHPLFATSDIWTTRPPFFFYQQIQERIDDDRDYWAENPDDCEGDEYYQYSLLPKEQWPEHVSDYLEFGSDYGAGVLTFGIRVADCSHDDPPVYMLHEANSLADWERISDNLSDFLMVIVCDVLSCAEYETAQEILQSQMHSGSNDVEKLLAAAGIDLSLAARIPSFYGTDTNVYCCYDDENTLYVIRKGEDVYKAYVVTV